MRGGGGGIRVVQPWQQPWGDIGEPPTLCTYPVSFHTHVPLEAGEAFLALRERVRMEMLASRRRGR